MACQQQNFVLRAAAATALLLICTWCLSIVIPTAHVRRRLRNVVKFEGRPVPGTSEYRKWLKREKAKLPNVGSSKRRDWVQNEEKRKTAYWKIVKAASSDAKVDALQSLTDPKSVTLKAKPDLEPPNETQAAEGSEYTDSTSVISQAQPGYVDASSIVPEAHPDLTPPKTPAVQGQGHTDPASVIAQTRPDSKTLEQVTTVERPEYSDPKSVVLQTHPEVESLKETPVAEGLSSLLKSHYILLLSFAFISIPFLIDIFVTILRAAGVPPLLKRARRAVKSHTGGGEGRGES